MVEVFDFQKNFKTGKETRKSKFKDNSITKGIATIELFDSNGSLTEKTVSNNFINNIFENSYIYKQISLLLSGNNYENSKVVNSQQFGQIQLRSGDFEEDKNTLFMRGDVIGWCPRTNTDAKTDTTRGVYNASESFEEITNDGYFHAHMVYDFATSQGNGTINHVYWTPAIYDNTKRAIACLSSLNSSPYTNSSESHEIALSSITDFVLDCKNDLYIYKNSYYYKVKNKFKFLNGFESPLIDENNSLVSIVRQMQRINDNLYASYSSSYSKGSNKTRACNLTLQLENIKTGEVEKTVTFDIINDFEGIKTWSDNTTSSSAYVEIRGIRTCTKSGNIYLNMYVYGGTLPVVNVDGSLGSSSSSREYVICYNILKDIWEIQPNIKSYLCYSLGSAIPNSASMKIDDNKYMLFRTDKQSADIIVLDESSFSATVYTESSYTNAFSFSNSSYNINALIGYDYITNTLIGYGNGKNKVTLNRFLPYTSHTKLPSPVTKTNTSTMKVTYDYYIQVPNMFAEKGKEFEWEQV